MCGFTDETKSVKNFLKNKFEKQLEELLLNPQLKSHKIATFIFFDDGKSMIFSISINFFYNRCNSLKHKKKTRNLEWKDHKEKEAPSIDIWNDVFLFTDKYSGENYAILLVNINLFQNNKVLSGADVFLQIGSLITSTYVINLSGKLSEENLKYLSFLNCESSNSSCSEKAFQNLMFLIRDWNNSSFEYGTNGGEKYVNHVWEKARKSNSDDLLKFINNLLKRFNNISCSLLPSHDDKIFKEELAKTCEFLLNSSNLRHFKKNGREMLEKFQSLNQKYDFFKYINLIDDNLPTLEHEEALLESSTFTNNYLYEDQYFSKNKNTRPVNENQESPKSPKQFKSSKNYSNDDDSNEDESNEIVAENEIARACMAVQQTKSHNYLNLSITGNGSKGYQKSASANKVENKIDENDEKKQKNKLFTLDDIKQYFTELSTNIEETEWIFRLPEDIFIRLFKFLNNDEKLNLIFTSEGFIDIFQVSRPILKDFEIKVSTNNFDKLWNHRPMHRIPMINLSFDFKGIERTQKFLLFFKKFEASVENLEIKNADFKNYNDFFEFLGNISNLKSLNLKKCKIGFIKDECFPQFLHLESIYFNKCNDNVFKVLQNQLSLKEISIRNDDWTWNGFPHEILNQMATNAKKLKKLTLSGSGTGSFFDLDEFTFKIEILNTSMITFHWYVGIKSGRVSFLKTQLGHLKKLTIHQLPFDFDGGKVLKFIVEEMKLDEFYYGKIPLILGGVKQDVKKFEATEIQITSIYEMFCQFPSISTFRFIISATDIASDAIERVINPPTNLFNNLKNFEVIDNSKYMRILGVFLGFFKNMINLKYYVKKTF